MTNATNFNEKGTRTENPTDAEVIETALDARALETFIHLPGTVVSISGDKADIQINIRKKLKNGTAEDRPVLSDVPIKRPRSDGGNAYLHLPIKKGDTGSIEFSQRSLDEWLVSGGNVTPKSTRLNSMSDATFTPGLYPFNNQTSEDPDNVVLKNGSMSLELYPDGKIKISGASQDFLSLMSDFIQTMIDAKVVTQLGPQPFIATTLVDLTLLKTKLGQLIP